MPEGHCPFCGAPGFDGEDCLNCGLEPGEADTEGAKPEGENRPPKRNVSG